MSHYGNRSTTRAERISRLIETDIYCCQSSLVDMLLREGLDGWTVDDIEGMYVDPSEWTVEQCKDFVRDEGITISDFDPDIETEEDYLNELRETIRDEAEPREPLEWWAVSSSLCSELRLLGEIVIDNDFGYWWGRTCSGQAIEMDGVWDDWCDFRGVE